MCCEAARCVAIILIDERIALKMKRYLFVRNGFCFLACIGVGFFLSAYPLNVIAGEVQIVRAKVSQAYSGGAHTFHVTLRHADTGWKHYANKFQIWSLDDAVLGSRVLLHPHVDEQPFTRSLFGIQLPSGTRTVKVRAMDTVHGLSPQTYLLDIPVK